MDNRVLKRSTEYLLGFRPDPPIVQVFFLSLFEKREKLYPTIDAEYKRERYAEVLTLHNLYYDSFLFI